MNPPKHIVAAGMLVERGDEVLLVRTERRGWEFPGGQRLQQLLSFDGRVLFQSYTTSPFTIHAQKLV